MQYENIKSSKRGLFITFEGVEGAGKSTVIRSAAEYLKTRNIPCILTREFGGTEIAEKIREVLLNHHYAEKMSPSTEVLLAFAARAQHLENLILPNLAKGTWVLCDRFTDATYAYQGAGRGVNAKQIEIIENWVQGEIRPDYTILLDLDASLGLERVKSTRKLDRIEVEKIEFFERVRENYLARAKKEPGRFGVLDASRSPEEVRSELEKMLGKIINYEL
ncbi:MAG: dTMP kinase [Gammaproteobacteria bacterium]